MSLSRKTTQAIGDALWQYRKPLLTRPAMLEPTVNLRDVIVAVADKLDATQAGFDRDRFLRHALEGKRS